MKKLLFILSTLFLTTAAFAQQPPDNSVAIDNDTIIIHLSNGKDKTLTSRITNNNQTTAAYQYQRFIPALNSHLILVQFVKAQGYLVINQTTGQELWLGGQPTVSPNGQRFISTSLDLLDKRNPNNIEIWIMLNNRFFKEFENSPSWGPYSATWQSDSKISIPMICLNKINEPVSCGQAILTLNESAEKWNLEAKPIIQN